MFYEGAVIISCAFFIVLSIFAIGAAVGCRTGGCAATVAATDGLPGIRPFLRRSADFRRN